MITDTNKERVSDEKELIVEHIPDKSLNTWEKNLPSKKKLLIAFVILIVVIIVVLFILSAILF